MNRHYDTFKAASILDQVAKNSGPVLGMEGTLSLLDLDIEAFCVTGFANPDTYRLTARKDRDAEAHFRLSGIICSKVLPPIISKPRIAEEKHLRNLRQFVKVTGFASPTFHEIQDKLDDIMDLFRQALGPLKLTSTEGKLWEGQVAVDCHARYFTDRESASQEKHLEFGEGVDPMNILDDLRGASLIHGSDNKVEYLTKMQDPDGVWGYEECNPSVFKEGDVVEVVVSFIAVPVKGGSYKLVTSMKALSLISNEVRVQSESLRIEEQQLSALSITTKRTLKRKPLFTEPAAKTKQPRIDNDDPKMVY
ncbi:hypothetical protein BKA70DRAFT_1561420 [Coprinopsis sp. MPI-PUGE-AT-0042]|nr:hypothetical protein BKA70DRAFT_1561420 [Coprinopsis sp. MPI-PUGE-AT-0042]